MSETVPRVDGARDRESHVLILTGGTYVAISSVAELVTLDVPLSPTELAIYLVLCLALVARYPFWSRQSYHSPTYQDLPWLLAGAVLVVIIVIVLQSQATLFLYLTVAEGCVVLLRRLWAGIWVIGISVISLLAYVYFRGWPAAGHVMLESIPVYLLLMVASDLWLHQEGQRRQVEGLLGELSEAQRRLDGYAAQAEALAVAEERTRLAREIHDTLGHALTGLDIQLELLTRLPASQVDARQEAAERARSLVKSGLVELRRAVRALRPGSMETFSLAEAIPDLLVRFRETTRIDVDWHCDGEVVPLQPALGVPLYRAAQEALTNVGRHAAATKARVWLSFSPDELTLVVEDNGRGGDIEPGFGLQGLRERAAALGGELHAGPAPNGGFRVEMKLPR